MAIMNKSWCDFVVYTKDLFVERITYDNEFWNRCFSKLQHFLTHALLPEIILKRVINKCSLYLQEKYSPLDI